MVVFVLAYGLTACTQSPWPAQFVPLSDPEPEPIETGAAQPLSVPGQPVLELVEFEYATPDRTEPGLRRIGFANFVGQYYRGIEQDLRDHASSIGASRVAWGLRYMHTERETHLQPIHDVWTSTRTGRVYDPHTGTYSDRDTTVTHTRTRYVPQVYEDVIYAFRAVYYAEQPPAAARRPDHRTDEQARQENQP